MVPPNDEVQQQARQLMVETTGVPGYTFEWTNGSSCECFVNHRVFKKLLKPTNAQYKAEFDQRIQSGDRANTLTPSPSELKIRSVLVKWLNRFGPMEIHGAEMAEKKRQIDVR